MPQITFDELEAQLLSSRLKQLFEQAYEQGVRDGMRRFSYPHVLTKKHLAEIFQVEMPTVTKIVAHPTFPKLKEVRARYPRDLVFKWIEEHSTFVEKLRGVS